MIGRVFLGIAVLFFAGGSLWGASSPRGSAPAKTSPAAFRKAVQPVLGQVCSACHNARLASAGLNLSPFLAPSSLAKDREGWEKILQKIRSGEMPPPDFPRPPQQAVANLLRYVASEFDRLDRATPRDPGRVVARRLNRAEYSNTIRDLLGVEFRADRSFPSDDSGFGFDNIGTVLTVSPVLMERYMRAAEKIAAQALGANPMPAKPVEVEYHARNRTIRRLDASTIEANHSVEWDAEYTVRFGFPGERPAGSKPVTMGFWMNGKLLKNLEVETKPSGLVYFSPYSEGEMRLHFPAGEHTFRAGFMNDDFVKGLAARDLYNREKNKFIESMTFVGPFPSNVEAASRKKMLVCDPNSGPACVRRILTRLTRRAYRRPVTAKDVAALEKFVTLARAEGQTVEQGIQLAIEAMLVSPHFLFRVVRERDARVHPISEVELASRLSYFLWSSMPDEVLLGLAERGRLRAPGVLDAQVKRMLADPRARALADNFAGQWLETRNLDSVTPDSKKFPAWGPALREAMKTETRLFFEHVLRENRPLSDFLDARYTFLNELLAKHYGIEGVSGPDFRRVELATDQRGGVLGHASVLTVSSYPTRTSVVIRGKYLLQNILGAPPPPPPPDVPVLDEAAIGATDTLRQQMEKHRSDPGCAGCHRRMDTLGFGLENYDAIGRWRLVDGKFPVDSSGTLPNGNKFSTPAELRKILLGDMPEFTRCLTEKMLTYALGRGVEVSDRRAITEITRKVAASGYGSQALITAIVHSFPFQMTRGQAAPRRNDPPRQVAPAAPAGRAPEPVAQWVEPRSRFSQVARKESP